MAELRDLLELTAGLAELQVSDEPTIICAQAGEVNTGAFDPFHAIAELVERTCRHAQRFAERLGALGAEILNDVELNQVLLRFSTDDETTRILSGVQNGGEAWMSGTTWDGRAAIRISISNWQTCGADVERTLAAYAGQLAAR